MLRCLARAADSGPAALPLTRLIPRKKKLAQRKKKLAPRKKKLAPRKKRLVSVALEKKIITRLRRLIPRVNLQMKVQSLNRAGDGRG